MKERIIKVELIRNGHRVEFVTKYRFTGNGTYVFDVPRINLEEWADARLRVTIKEVEEK